MAQQGSIFRKRGSRFLRYRDNFNEDGKIVRKQKCVKLADYGDRYRCASDLDELVAEKMAGVREAARCPHSSDSFISYIEEVYLPFVLRTMKPSTYSGYKTYWERYIKPRVKVYALRDFTIAVVVQRTLVALKGMPLERAAVGIMVFTGVRPGEARGLRWEEWDRAKQHIAVKRAVWHRVVGTTKTEQSERFVTVTDELREILLDLWKAQGSPISGYILAGRKGQPVILDNMSKRSITPALSRCAICKETESAGHKGHDFERDETLPRWHGWYSLRRFVGTEVRMKANSETSAKALGNSKAVADKHYIKPQTVLPDVRRAVNDAFSGLVQ